MDKQLIYKTLQECQNLEVSEKRYAVHRVSYSTNQGQFRSELDPNYRYDAHRFVAEFYEGNSITLDSIKEMIVSQSCGAFFRSRHETVDGMNTDDVRPIYVIDRHLCVISNPLEFSFASKFDEKVRFERLESWLINF